MSLRTSFRFLLCSNYKVITKRNFTASFICHNKVNIASKEDDQEEKTTHFGFETVKESEKSKKVYSIFENVAKDYDKMNDVMSFGLHRLWKDQLMSRLDPEHGCRLVDCAGGTGDITFRYFQYLKNKPNPKALKSHVTVFDINENMLAVGKARAKKQGFTVENGYDIAWVQGNAEEMSLESNSYTAYTIAFGLRNITKIEKALAEAYRVLKPGGVFLCLEFSQVQNEIVKSVYDTYSFQVIPVLGALITGQYKPYQYLVESIRRFPNQEVLQSLIIGAGFKNVTYENLVFGAVAIHKGYKM